MSRIAAAFLRARQRGRAAFIAYITAGDPSPSATVALCGALDAAGADIIELGVPFSDPLADGPTIQRACLRALTNGMNLAGCLEVAAQVRRSASAGLVLFTYYNPILKMGESEFVRRAAEAGVDGVLVTDLPVEESGPLRSLLIERGIDPIFLLAPTSGPERVRLTASAARGFIYYISRTGVTGARSDVPEGLAAEIAALKRATAMPVAVGFGISSAEQVAAVGALADGVVVGSELVSVIERAAGSDAKSIADLVQQVTEATRRLMGAGK